MFDGILVPTDGSDCADEAIGYAEDLATRYDATVHALRVVDSRVPDNAPSTTTRRKRTPKSRPTPVNSSRERVS